MTRHVARRWLPDAWRCASRAPTMCASWCAAWCAISGVAFTVSGPSRAYAQTTPTTRRVVDQRIGSLPRDVAVDAVTLFNARTTKRVRGDLSVAATDTIQGDVAVLGGRVQVSGVITGRLVSINGSVTLADEGKVRGALTVIGGSFQSSAGASADGEVRVWASRLRYRESDDSLVIDAEAERFLPFARLRRADASGPTSALYVSSTHTYNRVEGFPIALGPRFQNVFGETRIDAEVLGVFRTGDRLRWERANLGHRAFFQVQHGKSAAVAVGGSFFDVVDAVESWQLSATEVGLSSFLFTRDYHDYWQRHGASAHVALIARAGTELRAEYGEERWSTRESRGVWSLFNRAGGWRANPQTDEAVVHLATVTGRLDTRNDPGLPRSGWLIAAQVERGTGTMSNVAPTTINVRSQNVGKFVYTRGLLDARRYNRLAPGAQLNLRAVVGGWLGGDPLPLQRRLAVSGIDALPGFDFRRTLGTTDEGTCATGDDAAYSRLGRPAQCERIVLLQAEWKGDFRVRLFGDRDRFGDRRFTTSHFSADGSWVVFVNTGRGWLVNGSGTGLVYGPSRLPPPSSWRSDIGAGVDFGTFGVYVAQAVSQGGLRPNVYLRLGHRF